jgi:hypothetical protein
LTGDPAFVISAVSSIDKDGEISGAGIVGSEIHGVLLTPEN